MTQKVLLDSNIISYFLRGDQQIINKLQEYGQDFDYLTFSLLTYYEIKSGLQYRDAKNLMSLFHELAAESEIIPLDLNTINIASELYCDLRKRGLLMPPIDILIGATAIQHNLLLVTNNIKHFQRMPQLQFINWL